MTPTQEASLSEQALQRLRCALCLEQYEAERRRESKAKLRAYAVAVIFIGLICALALGVLKIL